MDCRNISTYKDFIEIFNAVMVRPAGGEWSGNLDAFNDYLSWPEDTPYDLIIIGTYKCKQILNYKENTKHQDKLWPLLVDILKRNKEFVNVEFK